MKEDKKVEKKVEKKKENKVEKTVAKKSVKKAEPKVEEKVVEKEEKKTAKAVAKKSVKKAEPKVEKVEVKEEKKTSKPVAKKPVKKAETKVEEKVEAKEEKKAPKKVTKKPVKKAEEKVEEIVEAVEEKKDKEKTEKKKVKKAEKTEEKTKKPEEKPEEPEEAEEIVDVIVEQVEEKKSEKAEKKGGKKKAPRKGTIVLESILDLNASNIWNLDEYSIAKAWNKAREEEDFSISEPKLLNTIRLAFDVVHYNPENEREAAKYENGGWASVKHCQEAKGCVAIRRRAIERITDLSYENIKHISTAMLLELINRNFGGGWDSIALAIRDIIETGFEISTTQLPQSRIHAPGGTVEKKVAQGFDVLEIQKGTWVEAIFAKKKDPVEKIHMIFPDQDDELETGEDVEEDDNMENDDTYFSSLTPEDDVNELEGEGLSIEDISDDSEDE